MAPAIPNRYADLHASPAGIGDARPTAYQIIQDNDLVGALRDKTFLVTGGTNGLGVDVVRQLAKTGARVFFTARDTSKAEKVKEAIIAEGTTDPELSDAKLEVVEMDLQSLDSVRAGTKDFLERSDQLNVLVCNAGIASTPFGLSQDGYEQQFAVNHLSHFLMVEMLKPLLLRSSTTAFNSRIVMVSSLAHTTAQVDMKAYHMGKLSKDEYSPMAEYAYTKTFNIWTANELERRFGSKGLHSVSVHPGGIYTGLLEKHDPSVKALMKEILEVDHIKKSLKSVEQGAASIVVAAVGKEYERIGGFYMEDCGISLPMSEGAMIGTPGYKPWAYDPESEGLLYTRSLQLLGMADDS